jgi:hypothetical protein
MRERWRAQRTREERRGTWPILVCSLSPWNLIYIMEGVHFYPSTKAPRQQPREGQGRRPGLGGARQASPHQTLTLGRPDLLIRLKRIYNF